MDDSSLTGLLVIFGLIAVHAQIALAYGALTNVRVNILRERAEGGNHRANQVLHLSRNTTNLAITYQFVTSILQFAISAIAVVNVTMPNLALLPGLSPLIAVSIVVVFFVGLTLIFGVLVPEAVGSAYANSIALWLIGPMQALITVMGPLVGLLLLASRGVSAMFSSSAKVNTVTEEEIMTLVDAGHTGGTIEEEEKEMIYSVLQLDETRVSEIMVPRIDIVALEINTALEDARAKFIASGYSRIPVYEDNIDTVKGILYAKDLLNFWHNASKDHARSLAALMRPAYFVPETKPVDELLKELQLRRVHIAVVVDEYGGTAGLVTIENIIEEIIGDIQDEYDLNEEAEYTEISPDEYIVDASIDLDDFNDLLDSDVPTEDNDTVGGFIYTTLGRVPEVGEVITYENLTMRVESVNGRRIRKVHVQRRSETQVTAENAEPAPEESNRDTVT